VKIAFLAPYPPYPPRGGGQQRVYQFIRHLARDHETWLLTFSPDDQATAALDPLRPLCHVHTIPTPRHTPGRRLRTLLGSRLPDMVLRGRSAAFGAALHDLLRAVPFDVVQCESIEMAQYGGARRGPLWVYDAFNAEFLLQRRAFSTDLRIARKFPLAIYSLIQWHKLKRYEMRLDRVFGGALAVSQDDAAILNQLAPQMPIGVVPNGVDTEFFKPDRVLQPDDLPLILFTGTLDFRPNIDAVTWFADAVLPLVQAEHPTARFAIVGRNPVVAVRELGDRRGIELVGEVDDVRPWFGRAAAYVVPMRIGGGVRLKLLEALAMEQAVVATPMGAEGVEGLQHGVHALLAADPAAFAAQVSAVLRDRVGARRLGSAGRELVVARYDWASIVPGMVALWEAWRAA
jgi:polysaccharide biosynthesis protein PslH